MFARHMGAKYMSQAGCMCVHMWSVCAGVIILSLTSGVRFAVAYKYVQKCYIHVMTDGEVH